jgi:hypothetical protein
MQYYSHVRPEEFYGYFKAKKYNYEDYLHNVDIKRNLYV